MLRPEIKRLAFFLILIFFFLTKSNYTDADLFAERIISRNRFSAITLDFTTRSSFNNNLSNNLFHSLGIQPGGFDLAAVKIKAETDSKLKYHLRAYQTNGDTTLCDNLHIKMLNRNFFEIFDGPLKDLSVDSKLDKSAPKDFIIFISLDTNNQSLQNKICEFNFDFKTYRNNPDETGGIFARRLITNVISSGDWQSTP